MFGKRPQFCLSAFADDVGIIDGLHVFLALFAGEMQHIPHDNRVMQVAAAFLSARSSS